MCEHLHIPFALCAPIQYLIFFGGWQFSCYSAQFSLTFFVIIFFFCFHLFTKLKWLKSANATRFISLPMFSTSHSLIIRYLWHLLFQLFFLSFFHFSFRNSMIFRTSCYYLWKKTEEFVFFCFIYGNFMTNICHHLIGQCSFNSVDCDGLRI